MYQRKQMYRSEPPAKQTPKSEKTTPIRTQARPAPPQKPSPKAPPKRLSIPFLEKLLPNMDSGDLLVLLILLLLLAEGNEDSSAVITTLVIFLFLR